MRCDLCVTSLRQKRDLEDQGETDKRPRQDPRCYQNSLQFKKFETESQALTKTYKAALDILISSCLFQNTI